MSRDDVLASCAALPGATEDYPFGEGAEAFKVGARMLALVLLAAESASIKLEREPGLAEPCAEYPAVRPGYHQNKGHWNTVELDGSIPDQQCREMITDSYQFVSSQLPRARPPSVLQQ